MTVQTVLRNNKGLTLVELLIASLITLILSLALMQTALLSINMNTRNSVRDEAVRISEMRMTELRNLPFTDTDLADTGGIPVTEPLVLRNFRNITDFEYTVTRTISDLNIDNKQVNLTVTWDWDRETYIHSISTLIRRQ